MKYFIVTLFYCFLSSVKLEAVRNANSEKNTDDIKSQKSTNMLGSPVPDIEEHIWPIRAYETFRRQFYGSPRSLAAKPCSRQEGTMEQQPDPELQLTASPTRRASNAENKLLFEPAILQPQVPKVITREGDIFQSQTRHYSADELLAANNVFEVTTSSSSHNIQIHAPMEVETEAHYVASLPATIEDSSAESPPVLPLRSQCSDNKQSQNSPNTRRQSFDPINEKLPDAQTTENSNILRNTAEYTNSGRKYIISEDNQRDTSTLRPGMRSYNETGQDRLLDRSGDIRLVIDGRNQLQFRDPTQGKGISYIKKNSLMLMDFDRVCYACSTANNPTCLSPDRKTSVKYCRKGDDACVTMTFKTSNTLTIVRDCGNVRSCEAQPNQSPQFKYSSCSLCQNDLCNGSYSANVNSLILILSTFAIVVFGKPLLG